MVTKIEVSVVLPVLDEVESLGVLHRELTEALERLGRSYEILFIDDGSRDGSFQLIEKLSIEDSRVRGFQFRRNFGKAAPLAVGFREALGDIVVTLDADP
jgi:glycosyltransferase involved in cell wall biosynthesis